MKKLVCLLACVILLVSLSACSGGISGSEAKAYINDFLKEVEKGEYTAAETYLHPDRPADLQAFFEGVAAEENLDFSQISVEKYTNFASALYESAVGGARYALTMKVSVSGKPVKMEIEIVKNDNGYGIYNFDLDAQ